MLALAALQSIADCWRKRSQRSAVLRLTEYIQQVHRSVSFSVLRPLAFFSVANSSRRLLVMSSGAWLTHACVCVCAQVRGKASQTKTASPEAASVQ